MSTGASHTTINQADVAGAIGGYYGVISSDPRIQQLLNFVLPDVERAAAHSPRDSWRASLNSVIQKYDGLAKELGLGVSPMKRDIDAARHANVTDATFAGALARLGWIGLQHYAAVHNREGSGAVGGGAGGTAERSLSMASGGSVERTFSAALSHDTPLSATGAVGFARQLGVNPAQAGFFVGASPQMQQALHQAIHNGKPITDDQVRNPRDVSAILGAIRAGKIKPDDPRVPPSVRQIIENMKKQGIDPTTADPKAIQKYLKEHPKELDEVRKANNKTLESVAPKSDDQLKKDNLDKKVNVVSPPPKADPKKPEPKVQSAKL
jgi:hypothetical protein